MWNLEKEQPIEIATSLASFGGNSSCCFYSFYCGMQIIQCHLIHWSQSFKFMRDFKYQN